MEQKLSVLRLHLKDTAKAYVRELTERVERCDEDSEHADDEDKEAKVILSDWKKFRKAFIGRFSDPRQDQHVLNQFFNRYQQDKESIQEYADALTNIAARIKKKSLLPEETKIAHFGNHVKPQIKLNLTTSGNVSKTLSGVVQEAVIVETALKEYKESFNNDQKKKDRRGDDRSEYKQKKPYGNRDRNSDGTFAATANHDRPKRDTSDITCYACNQKGHYATSCPK